MRHNEYNELYRNAREYLLGNKGINLDSHQPSPVVIGNA